MANEIILPVGATAEPDTCGSCEFFSRYLDRGISYVGEGSCRFKFPPFKERYATVVVKDNYDDIPATNDMKDTDRCDLQRSDGKVYIVQRRIPPLREG